MGRKTGSRPGVEAASSSKRSKRYCMFMAVTTQVSVEEYLRTSYDPDCEYVDGEVLDRNVGEKGHSKVQKRLLVYIAQHEARWGVFALQEWRLKLAEGHYR